eukprot:TRINITY_DN2824_c0_g1_i1.p1 TRINITY_DN2824_c0_g1~~TRINITY_DN2824_c0_g1_i1.p1  ORF type:complete len:470 (+),score=123.52 TRINITY_DN2824_c0_g1_i1:64-1473(+)
MGNKLNQENSNEEWEADNWTDRNLYDFDFLEESSSSEEMDQVLLDAVRQEITEHQQLLFRKLFDAHSVDGFLNTKQVIKIVNCVVPEIYKNFMNNQGFKYYLGKRMDIEDSWNWDDFDSLLAELHQTPPERHKKYVLCCDSGGVRGAATAQFLYHLENELGRPLREVFDMFVGSSTGAGICSSFIYGQTAAEVRENYSKEACSRAMPKNAIDSDILMLNTSKYDGRGKTDQLRDIFENTLMGDLDKELVITAYSLDKRKIHMFSSSRTPYVKIAEAVDATTSAPIYFPPIFVDNEWMIDGGVVASDPALVAFHEAKRFWSDYELCILSVGTGKVNKPIPGHKAQKSKWGLLPWISKGELIDVMLDSSMIEIHMKLILGDNYIRIDREENAPETSDKLDDHSLKNLEALRELGDFLWDVNREKTLKMFGIKAENVHNNSEQTDNLEQTDDSTQNDPILVLPGVDPTVKEF